jgi:hypothetical protein
MCGPFWVHSKKGGESEEFHPKGWSCPAEFTGFKLAIKSYEKAIAQNSYRFIGSRYICVNRGGEFILLRGNLLLLP